MVVIRSCPAIMQPKQEHFRASREPVTVKKALVQNVGRQATGFPPSPKYRVRRAAKLCVRDFPLFLARHLVRSGNSSEFVRRSTKHKRNRCHLLGTIRFRLVNLLQTMSSYSIRNTGFYPVETDITITLCFLSGTEKGLRICINCFYLLQAFRLCTKSYPVQ